MPMPEPKYTLSSLQDTLADLQRAGDPVALRKELDTCSKQFWFGIYSVNDSSICEWPDGTPALDHASVNKCLKWWRDYGHKMAGAYFIVAHSTRNEVIAWKPRDWKGATLWDQVEEISR